MFKLFVGCALLSAAVLAAPQHGDHGHDGHYDHHSEPHYEFGYSVQDKHTGDVKSQHETRNKDQVQGEYSFVEPDGHIRNVKYHADKHSGFNAVVHREATLHHAPQHGGHGEDGGNDGHGHQIVQLSRNEGHGHGISLGNIGGGSGLGNLGGHGIGHSHGISLGNIGGSSHGISSGHGISLENIGGSSHGHGISSGNLGGHGISLGHGSSQGFAGHYNNGGNQNAGGHHEITGKSTVYLHSQNSHGHEQNAQGHHY